MTEKFDYIRMGDMAAVIMPVEMAELLRGLLGQGGCSSRKGAANQLTYQLYSLLAANTSLRFEKAVSGTSMKEGVDLFWHWREEK